MSCGVGILVNATETLRSSAASSSKPRMSIRSVAPGMYMVLDLLARSRYGMTLSELVNKSPSKAVEVLQELYPGIPEVLVDSLIASIDDENKRKSGEG